MSSQDIIVRKNERSWAIEIISQINRITSENDLVIKRAGGESTISYSKSGRMFPDVILYEDKELSRILQGWELKCLMCLLQMKPLLRMHNAKPKL